MQVLDTLIPGVRLLRPARFGDGRGFFSETYSRRALAASGIRREFVQDNHSLSGPRGVVRGLHFQVPPAAQAKLVRVVRGAILDVALDLRAGSPTFGRHVAATVSAADWNQIYVPEGFAHGFCTLEPDTEVEYKVSAYYAPVMERGVAWDDPALGIAWPIGTGEAVLSPRDRAWPRLADLPDYFRWRVAEAAGAAPDAGAERPHAG